MRDTYFALALLMASIFVPSFVACTPAGGAANSEAQSPDAAVSAPDGWALVPAGQFEMGDHHNLGGKDHPSDEIPVHKVRVDSFYMGKTEVTNAEFCRFLNSAVESHAVIVRDGLVYDSDGETLYCDTDVSDPASSVSWDGRTFSLKGNRANHPAVCVRWNGAAAYCNWLSITDGYSPCYVSTTWQCDYSQSGFRLPTEAEWEYAALGGQTDSHPIFPWGDVPEDARANWPNSGDPYETGPFPWTTPVGFYNGELHKRSAFSWPSDHPDYQTANGANAYGLYDMSGNIWEWTNDWYDRDYYASSPAANPSGPASGQPMPDGKPYRVLRSGNWYNGEWGHGRISNRDPAYFRGPDDPNHAWYHVGFRVVRSGPGATGSMDSGGIAVTLLQSNDQPSRQQRTARQNPGSDRPPSQKNQPWRADKFQATDSNGDGAISLDEFLFHEEKKFNRIDTDKSRRLSSPEMEADEQQQKKSPGGGYSRFEQSDADHDNSVSLAEYLASEKVKFSEWDSDKDGRLSPAELEATPPSKNLPGMQRNGEGDRDRPAIGEIEQVPRGSSAQREVPRDRGPREKPVLNLNVLTEGKLGLVHNTDKAAPGYTLFAPKHRTMTYLIDNAGRVVHEWKRSQYEPGQTVFLLENGHLLRCCFTHARGFTRGGEGGRIEEYDWDDNLVWEFDYANNEHILHHDIALLPNGNILALAVERKSLDECIAAGFEASMISDGELYPDYVIEIEPVRPKGGKIVWEWHVWDHLVQERDLSKTNYGRVAEHPERVDVNCNGRRVPAFWNHMNSIAYNATLDQIALSVRGCNEVWIVDHSTPSPNTSRRDGDLLFRWGNPAAYGRGDSADRRLFQQHDAHWIPAGYPGAGNILIFNNGLDRDHSSIEEIVPPLDASGHYTLMDSQAYGPSKPVWSYTARNKADFYSPEISGAHRLPNGNTLICAGVLGTFFEVTSAGETVWKYVNPVVRGGTLAQGERPGVDERGHYLNAVFKVHRYPPDFAGFAGRDLTPIGPIELPSAMYGKTGLDNANTEPDRRRPEQGGDTETERENILRSIGYL